MNWLLTITGIGFCMVFISIVVYAVYNASKMKALDDAPAAVVAGVSKSDMENIIMVTEKIKEDLGKITSELKRRDIEDEALNEPIADIEKVARLLKRRSLRSYTGAIQAFTPAEFEKNKIYFESLAMPFGKLSGFVERVETENPKKEGKGFGLAG